MDSVGSVSNTDYSSYITNAKTDNLANSISNLNKETATADELMEACKDFETYMVEQVYKQMEKTIMKSDEQENEYEEYFGDYRTRAYAEMVTEQGKLGLAQQLYDSMTRNRSSANVINSANESTATGDATTPEAMAAAASSVNATGTNEANVVDKTEEAVEIVTQSNVNVGVAL